jgi:hypothetical protein
MPRWRMCSRAVAAGAPGRMTWTPRVMISETGLMHMSLATAMPQVVQTASDDSHRMDGESPCVSPDWVTAMRHATTSGGAARKSPLAARVFTQRFESVRRADRPASA